MHVDDALHKKKRIRETVCLFHAGKLSSQEEEKIGDRLAFTDCSGKGQLMPSLCRRHPC